MSANAETQTPQQPVKKSGKRKRLLLLLTLLFIIIAVAIGIYWFLVLRHFEETDDAYVAGNQIQIMSQVSGSVTKVWADNTDFVKEGDVLVLVDSLVGPVPAARATVDGVVIEVTVGNGQIIDQNDQVAVISE